MEAETRDVRYLMLLLLTTTAARATDIEVHVVNTADAAGVVRVRVCTAQEWLKDCAIDAQGPARPGVSVVTVRGVPPGVYGVIAHHDSDGDGEVGRNLLGIPTEGVGFSRDPSLGLTGPRFDHTAVQVAGPRVVLDIRLHFERATPSR